MTTNLDSTMDYEGMMPVHRWSVTPAQAKTAISNPKNCQCGAIIHDIDAILEAEVERLKDQNSRMSVEAMQYSNELTDLRAVAEAAMEVEEGTEENWPSLIAALDRWKANT